MTDGQTYDFCIAIDYNGHQHVLDPPEGFAEWAEKHWPGRYSLKGLPVEPGIYRVVARYAAHTGRPLGWPYDDAGFNAVEYEELRLVGSGTVVPVVNEAIEG